MNRNSTTSCKVFIVFWIHDTWSGDTYLAISAAAAAASLHSCPTLWDPNRWPPTRLLCPWDSPGKNTGMGCHFLLQCMKVESESEVTQSYPTLRNPMGCSPPGSSVPGILQVRTLEWVAISFSSEWKWKVKVKSLSPVLLLATPWTAAEYWSGLPLPSPAISNYV